MTYDDLEKLVEKQRQALILHNQMYAYLIKIMKNLNERIAELEKK